MCRNPVPQPRRNLSGIGRGADIWEKAASAVTAVTWGARGSLHMRSVAPGPMCAEVCPLAIARDLPIPVAPARFRAWGQGHTPAPRFLSRLPRRRGDNLATTIASANQGGVGVDDNGASRVRRDSISVHPLFMTQWIANLFSDVKPKRDAPSLMNVFFDRDLRLDVKEFCLPCGHISYLVELHWYSEKKRDWLDMALVHESDLESTINLLQQASTFLKAL
jgi:hypothetical protein